MSVKIIDSHAHYDDSAFNGDREQLLSSMFKSSVELIIEMGCSMESSRNSVALSQKYPQIYAAVGVHPEDCSKVYDGYIEELEQLSRNEKVVAIGEIGLDYHYDGFDREKQIEVFEQQLILAQRLNLPVVIHSRDATKDCMELLKKYKPKGVVHCFSGSAETAKEIISLGMYIGFFVLLGAMIYACVEIDKKSALYCAVWSLLTAQTAYEGWNLFELLCAVKSHPLNMNSVPVKLLQVLTGVVFYGVICGTLARKIPDKGVYHIGPRQLASAFFMGIMFMLQAALLSSAQALDWPMSVVGTTLIGQLYFLTLLYLQTELFKKSDLQKEMETLNLLYERQRQQYQVARQNVNIINKRCHELRVQIAALRKLAPDAVPRETLEEAENAARLYDAGANSGNEVLDVVLTEKTLLCQSRRVQLNAVANGSCLRGFEPGDLYALFANALDYAIEGAVRTPDPARRNIDLLVCVRQSFIVINVISPAPEPEAAATRTEAYELKVLRRIVQKYSGTLTTETQNGFFAIKIIFPLKQGE